MKKNIASQYVYLQAWNTAAAPRSPETGDTANISAFISLDGAAESAATNSVTEVDATNMPGIYALELSQAETNADSLAVFATSITGNIELDLVMIHTTTWTFDGQDFDDIMLAVMAVLFGRSAVTGSSTEYKLRDGTTTKVTVVADTAGNRTASTVA